MKESFEETGRIIDEIEVLLNQLPIEDTIEVKKLHPDAKCPSKAHDTDAGWDLYSVEYIEIPPQGRRVIKTGISMAIPEGYVGLIWPRSGLAVKNGLDVFAGVIDSGYRGEIMVCLYNSTDNEYYHISPSDKIAQILFQEVPTFEMVLVDELDSTERNTGGFGSSGV